MVSNPQPSEKQKLWSLTTLRQASGVITAAAALVVAVVYLATIPDIKQPKVVDMLGPRFFPTGLGVLFLGLSLAYLASEAYGLIRAYKAYQHLEPDPTAPRRLTMAAGTVILAALFVTFFESAGYIVTSALFIAFLLVLSGRKQVAEIAVFSALIAGAFYVVFRVWLNIPLPSVIFD